MSLINETFQESMRRELKKLQETTKPRAKKFPFSPVAKIQVPVTDALPCILRDSEWGAAAPHTQLPMSQRGLHYPDLSRGLADG